MTSLSPLSAAHAPHHQSSPDGRSSTSSSAGSSPSSSGPSSSRVSSLSLPPSNQNITNGTNDDDEDTIVEPLVRWTKKPRRKRTGWGPYQSVLNERSVDFNLTLDVQNLKQEIQHMQTYRELLASRTLIQRHDPNGSLVRAAQEHYRIFRTGFNLRETGRKRLSMDEKDQRQFLRSVFDENVECGAGANGDIQRGLDVMEQQIMLYTVFIKSIAMTLTNFEVVVADDTVIVSTKGIMHFQILRATIAGMFPHVLGEEWLMAKLVGQEVAPESGLDFHFNKHNKVCKFVAKLDFVKTFADVLSSPEEVETLFGRALITKDCLILPNTEKEKIPVVSPTGSNSTQAISAVDSGSGSGISGDAEDLGSSPAEDSDHSHGGKPSTTQAARTTSSVHQGETTSAATAPKRRGPTKLRADVPAPVSTTPLAQIHPMRAGGLPPTISAPTSAAVSRGPMTPIDHFNSVIQTYFQVFSQGCHGITEAFAAEFITRYFSPNVEFGDAVGRQVLHDRWRSLSWCFDVLSFRQVSPGGARAPSQPPVAVYESKQNRYRIETYAEYVLQLTVRTVELVFPHVMSDLELMNLLVGSRIVVSSELSFWLERGTGLLAKVSERMAFEEAFSQLVEGSENLAYVLQGAQPILTSFEGRITAVSSSQSGQRKTPVTGRESPSSPSSPSSPNDLQGSETEARMRLSVILD